MYEEPEEPADSPENAPRDPAVRAKEKSDEFRMHAELCAVFEGVRKFDAQIDSSLDPEIAREVQRAIAKLEKTKKEGIPLIATEATPDAVRLLNLPREKGITTNDYHIHRRFGETMIVRWLSGAEVESFYKRLQAHFDAAFNQYREEEKQSLGWKQDPDTQKYLEALEKIAVKMDHQYAREFIVKTGTNVLSTYTADEMDIFHLCDFIMGIPAAQVVGAKSAPPEDPTEQDRAWFFKLFSLRGVVEVEEKMCFFTYLQKADADEF